MDTYLSILKRYWGYDDFRGIQRDIIESIGSGRDTLGLMPTGGGKSITFQVPALSKPGMCVVITPLIALMKDQVEALNSRGIKAACIHSGLSHEQTLVILENSVFNAYKFLYISPERLSSELFLKKLGHMNVNFITVDEAHCICQWGYDFRPSYLQIAKVRKIKPGCPVLALTATSTPEVARDIQKNLCFKEENVIRMSFFRPNLAYKVLHADATMLGLLQLLNEYDGSCIVYTRNRQNCEDLSKQLTEYGFSSTYYHAGLKAGEKDARQDAWLRGNYRIMVATNAFGMGIDKADVRLVVHIDLPDSIEEYFQEAGRAGRDGKPASSVIVMDGKELEQIVFRAIRDYIHLADKNRKKAKIFQKDRQRTIRTEVQSIAGLQEEIARLKQDKLKLYEKYCADRLNRNAYLAEKTVIDERIAKLETDISSSEERVSGLEEQSPEVSSELEAACVAFQKESVLTYDMAHAFVDRILVHGPRRVGGMKIQPVEIMLKHIGKVDLPEEEPPVPLTEEELAAEKRRRRQEYDRRYYYEKRKPKMAAAKAAQAPESDDDPPAPEL